jgi:hypothetical protein
VEFHCEEFKKAPRLRESPPPSEMGPRGIGHIPFARMKAALACQGQRVRGVGTSQGEGGSREEVCHLSGLDSHGSVQRVFHESPQRVPSLVQSVGVGELC